MFCDDAAKLSTVLFPSFFLLASLRWSGSKCDQPVRARPEQTEAGVVVVVVEAGVFGLLPERQTERNVPRAEQNGTTPVDFLLSGTLKTPNP